MNKLLGMAVACVAALSASQANAALLHFMVLTGPEAARIGQMPPDMIPSALPAIRSGFAQTINVPVVLDGRDHVSRQDFGGPGAVLFDTHHLSVTRTQSVHRVIEIWYNGTPARGFSTAARIIDQIGLAGETPGPAHVTGKVEGSIPAHSDGSAVVNYEPAHGDMGDVAYVLVYQPD